MASDNSKSQPFHVALTGVGDATGNAEQKRKSTRSCSWREEQWSSWKTELGGFTSQEARSREDSRWCIWRWAGAGGDHGNGERRDRVEGRWSWAMEEAVIRKLYIVHLWIVHLNFSITALRWLCGDGDQLCRPPRNTMRVGGTGQC